MYFTFRGRLALLPPFARMSAAWRWVPSKCAQLGAHMSSQAPGVEFTRVISFSSAVTPASRRRRIRSSSLDVEPDFDELSLSMPSVSMSWRWSGPFSTSPWRAGSRASNCTARRIPIGAETADSSQLREEVNNQFSSMFAEHVDIAAHRLDSCWMFHGRDVSVRDYSLLKWGFSAKGEQGLMRGHRGTP